MLKSLMFFNLILMGTLLSKTFFQINNYHYLTSFPFMKTEELDQTQGQSDLASFFTLLPIGTLQVVYEHPWEPSFLFPSH